MMHRNYLYIAIGLLAVIAAVLGFQVYQERQATSRIEIEIGEGGVSIQKK